MNRRERMHAAGPYEIVANEKQSPPHIQRHFTLFVEHAIQPRVRTEAYEHLPSLATCRWAIHPKRI